MEGSSFSSGRGPFRQNDSRKNFGSFQRDLSVWCAVLTKQILEDFNETMSCASKRDSNYNFGQGIIIQCCVPVPEGKEILIHEDEVCCKKYIGWIGDFRRSHQVGRRLTSSWHQKKQPTWCLNSKILWNSDTKRWLVESTDFWQNGTCARLRHIGRRCGELRNFFVECWAFGNWGNNQNMQVRWCDDMVIVPKWRELLFIVVDYHFNFQWFLHCPILDLPFLLPVFFGNS